jgi:hypothetical protein
MGKLIFLQSRKLYYSKQLLLEILSQLNGINKLVQQGNYTVRLLGDSSSNLKILAIETDRVLALKRFYQYYKDTITNTKRVHATLSTKNLLYSNTRHFLLEFTEIDSALILTSYTIEGIQKMALGDTVKFEIKSTIRIK